MNYPRYLGWKYGGLDAEDLGQELSILEWLGKRAGEHPTQTRAKLKWKAIDYYRHEKRRRKYWGPYDETVISRLIAPEPLQKLLTEITFSLPPPTRKIFNSMAQGYSVREISQRLNVSRGKISRERVKIAKIIKNWSL